VKHTSRNMRNCQIELSMYLKILQKNIICWKCVARKFSFVYLLFDPLLQNSYIAYICKWNDLHLANTRSIWCLSGFSSKIEVLCSRVFLNNRIIRTFALKINKLIFNRLIYRSVDVLINKTSWKYLNKYFPAAVKKPFQYWYLLTVLI